MAEMMFTFDATETQNVQLELLVKIAANSLAITDFLIDVLGNNKEEREKFKAIFKENCSQNVKVILEDLYTRRGSIENLGDILNQEV